MQTAFNSIEGKRVRTLEADPQYFGGYLNMARHNIFSINNHVKPSFTGVSMLRNIPPHILMQAPLKQEISIYIC
jgi:hypothetical protein